MATADLEVDGVVARRHLDDPGAELGIDGLVGHHPHGDVAVDRRDVEGLADVLAIPLGRDLPTRPQSFLRDQARVGRHAEGRG